VDISELDKSRYLNLVTFRKTGAEVSTPVWFAAWGDKLYAFSQGSSGKVKRLRNSSRARIAPCDVSGKVLGEWRDTSARIIGDPDLVARAYAALRKKFGWQVALLTLGARLTGAVKKRVYIEIDF
jgi:PPOX class probable F420-dependent enzyme